jgi:hypothetical protein
VYLPVSLTAPAPSGSTGTTRLCRGCSHPPADPRLRLPPASPHRYDGKAMDGLSPPFGQTAPRGARFSRIPSRLAHRARPIRQCRDDATLSRLLPPSPPTRGSGCLQLHPTATTAGRWTVFHLHSGNQRLVAHYPAGYPRPRPGGGRTAGPGFPLPSGGRHSLLGHPFPPGIPPLLRSAYRHQVPDHDGVSTFRTHEIRPEWAPSVPRDLRCSHEPGPFPGPPPAALPRHGSYHPGTSVTYPELSLTRHQSRVHLIRPPGLPLTRGPRMTRGPSGFTPGLRTRASRTRARTPGQGQAPSTSLEHRHQHYVMLVLQSARFTRICATSCRTRHRT